MNSTSAEIRFQTSFHACSSPQPDENSVFPPGQHQGGNGMFLF